MLELVLGDTDVNLDAILTDDAQQRHTSVDQLCAGVDELVGIPPSSFLVFPKTSQ